MKRFVASSFLSDSLPRSKFRIGFKQGPPCLRPFTIERRLGEENDSTSTFKPPAPQGAPSSTSSPSLPVSAPARPTSASFEPVSTIPSMSSNAQSSPSNSPFTLSRSLSPKSSNMINLGNIIAQNESDRHQRGNSRYPKLDFDNELRQNQEADAKAGGRLWHLHVYAHRHNTHITLTRPNHDPEMSLSCGNLGFRNASRKSYDSSWQLAVFFFKKVQERGLLAKIQEMELCYRGFGKGREAVTKVLMGAETKVLKSRVVKVSDCTRLKFGGTRSPNVRRR